MECKEMDMEWDRYWMDTMSSFGSLAPVPVLLEGPGTEGRATNNGLIYLHLSTSPGVLGSLLVL